MTNSSGNWRFENENDFNTLNSTVLHICNIVENWNIMQLLDTAIVLNIGSVEINMISKMSQGLMIFCAKQMFDSK